MSDHLSVHLSTLSSCAPPTGSSYERSRLAAESYAQRTALRSAPAHREVTPRRLLARLVQAVS